VTRIKHQKCRVGKELIYAIASLSISQRLSLRLSWLIAQASFSQSPQCPLFSCLFSIFYLIALEVVQALLGVLAQTNGKGKFFALLFDSFSRIASFFMLYQGIVSQAPNVALNRSFVPKLAA
jgi:hypothetical protein